FLFQSRHIRKRDFDLILPCHPGTALPEVHCLCIRPAVLPVQQIKKQENTCQRDQQRKEDRREHGCLRYGGHTVSYIILIEEILYVLHIRDIHCPCPIPVLQHE